MTELQEQPYRAMDDDSSSTSAVSSKTLSKPKTKGNPQKKKKSKAEFERIRESGRERLLQLSQPKEPKAEWYTSVGPQFYYSCGRESVLWKVGGGAKKAVSTERLDILAEPKKAHRDFQEDRAQFAYSCGRQSPIWTPDRAAMSCGDRPRTRMLARHKELHKDFAPEKPVQSIVSPTAMGTQASERLHYLSTPKNRNEGPFRNPRWEVTPSAKNATATSRCLELARPKGVVDGYQLPRDEEWPVSRAAKRASSTGRIEELSKPIVRATMDHVQFNPDAFLVKPLALKGSFPPRVEQLAKAIER